MFCGGQGIYIHYLSRELSLLGHDVYVMSGPPYPQVADGVKLIKLISKSILVPRYGYTNGVTPIRSPIDLYEFIATSIGLYAEPFAFSIRAYHEIKNLAPDIKFDVIHDNQCLGYGLSLIKSMGLPLVATIHHPIGIDRFADFILARNTKEKLTRRWFYSFYVPMQSYVGCGIDQIITVSECSAKEIERLMGIPASRIKVVYNGVDTSHYRNRNGTSRTPNSLVFVGNTEDRKKGIIYLLQALNLLKDEYRIKLTIVDGGAPDTDYATTLVREYGLEDHVTIVRRLDSDQLVHRYSEAEIAVIPSLFEGFGFPAAEAMACELPVIASNAGALPELVSNGENGILIQPGNVQELVNAIKHLINNKELRQTMGSMGRQIAQEKFSWRQAAEQTLDVYRAAIS